MKNTAKIISGLLVTLLTTVAHPMDNKRPQSNDFEQQTQTKRMRVENAPSQPSTMNQAMLILERIKSNTKKTQVKFCETTVAKQPSTKPITKTISKTIPLPKLTIAISTTAQKSTLHNQSAASSSSSSSQQTPVKIKHHTKLHKAAKNNDANTIRKLLQPVLSQQILLKKIINALTNKGLTPLMFAAHYGSVDAFDALLENGADVTIKSPKNKTVFDFVAKRLNELGKYNTQESRFITMKRDRFIYIYNKLLPYFADKLTERQAQQKLPSYRSVQSINRFYTSFGSDKSGAFQRAIMAADIDEVERLLKEHPEYISRPNDAGDMPLHVAVKAGHVYVTKLLLKNQTNPYEKNKAGKNIIDIVDEILATITEAPAAGTFEYNVMQINLLLKEIRMVGQISNQLAQASNAQSSSSAMPLQQMAASTMSHPQQTATNCLQTTCCAYTLPRNVQ